MPEDSTRTEPVLTDDQYRLNIDQQRKRARELQRALKAGDADALQRAVQHHPKGRERAPQTITQKLTKLSDAQLIIARELGLESWPKLLTHIEQLTNARDAIAGGASALDADRDTAHIRCGSDIREGLQTAGFVGDFVEFADPYCHGPVPDGDRLLDIRASFIAKSYGLPIEEIRAREHQEHADLTEACSRERIVLWFEHDSYDQLILARILALFNEQKELRAEPARIELICVDRFPAITRFNGLGQLSPAALRMLWRHRQKITSEMLQLGSKVWNALRQKSPEALYAIAAAGTPALPNMAPALLRHLQELPGSEDGLSLTERLTLQMLAEGPMTGGELFRKLLLEVEPLPYLGDLMYWSFLVDLAKAGQPPIEVDTKTRKRPWPERKVFLTPIGEDLLTGRADLQLLGAAPRWIGGVEISKTSAPWRWHRGEKRPVLK